MAKETKAQRKARKAEEKRLRRKAKADKKAARREYKVTKKATARGGQVEKTKRRGARAETRQTRAKEKTKRTTVRQTPENVAARQAALAEIGVAGFEAAGDVGAAYFGGLDDTEFMYGIGEGVTEDGGYDPYDEDEDEDEDEEGYPAWMVVAGLAGLGALAYAAS